MLSPSQPMQYLEIIPLIGDIQFSRRIEEDYVRLKESMIEVLLEVEVEVFI